MSEAVMRRLAKPLLFLAAFIWGTSFFIMKNTLDAVPPFWLLVFRFTTGAVLLGLFCWKKWRTHFTRDYLWRGGLFGVFLFIAYTTQTFGLTGTTPSKNAFLTATYCVLVPFLWWAFERKRPDRYNLLAALVCITGMAMVSLSDGLTVGPGEALTMCCGLFYALHIIFTSKGAAKYGVGVLTTLQFATAALLCWVTAPFSAPFPAEVPAGAWLSIAYLCVMCTGVCYLLQTIGQKYTSPQTSSILLTLESVFGTVISVIFYHEQLTVRELTGFVLIFIAVIISETKLEFLRGRHAAGTSEA